MPSAGVAELGYVPPDWGKKGVNVFNIYVEVIKGGMVIETLQLPLDAANSYVVAGRMEPLCDLVLQHPSISRMHAVLQFDEKGALFLRDLKSTYGTFVNKKRIPPQEFQRLHIGDIIVFGESTRLYAVCGPPELLPAEYDSLNLRKFREKIQHKRDIANSEKKKRVEQDENGASWGFREDAQEEDDDDVDSDDEEQERASKSKKKLPDYLRNLKEDEVTAYKSRVSKSDVNEKDQQLFQQLQTRIKKMENLKLEKSRILAKQHQLTGLSKGQEKTLERNEQRIQALLKEIETIEDKIHAKNVQREQTAGDGKRSSIAVPRKNRNENLYGYDSDEDDFYDRTKANQAKHLERKQRYGDTETKSYKGNDAIKTDTKRSVAMTYESIQEAIENLEKELQQVSEEFAACCSNNASESAESKQEDKEMDSLDSFMETTSKQLQTSQRESIYRRKLDVEKGLQYQRQLLRLATPALAFAGSQKSKPDELIESTGSIKEVAMEAPKSIDKPISPPSSGSTEQSSGFGQESELTTDMEPKTSDKIVFHAEKKTRTQERRQEHYDVADSSQSQTKKRRVVGPVRGPLEAPLSSSRKTDAPHKKLNKKIVDSNIEDGNELEGGDRMWVPPANQTGDGRTSLNDAYGY